MQKINAKPSFKGKNITMGGWLLTPTPLHDISWVEDENWDDLKRDYCTLSMDHDYAKTVLREGIVGELIP